MQRTAKFLVLGGQAAVMRAGRGTWRRKATEPEGRRNFAFVRAGQMRQGKVRERCIVDNTGIVVNGEEASGSSTGLLGILGRDCLKRSQDRTQRGLDAATGGRTWELADLDGGCLGFQRNFVPATGRGFFFCWRETVWNGKDKQTTKHE